MQDIHTILAEMTLEEKAGQLIMSSFVGRNTVPDDMVALLGSGAVGSILYFSGCNVVDPVQLRDLTEKVQTTARKNRFGIPVFVAIDQEGGQLAPITCGVSIGPGNMALAAIRDEKDAVEAAYENGRITGEELASIGITTCFAPVVDLCFEEGLPVKDNRYFGSDPVRAGKLGAAFIRGLNSAGVMSCAKHFPGQRNVDIDSHFELDILPGSVADMMKREWIPFQEAINADVSMIMTLHAGLTAVDPTNTPATLSKPIIDGMLKKNLGFGGLVVSDDIQMKPIKDKYGIDGAVVKCIAAGVDIIIVSGGVSEANAYIADGVRRGEISVERLDEAVRKVLEYKQKFIRNEVPPHTVTDRVCASADKLSTIQRYADKSITLLRNSTGLLPLRSVAPDSRIGIVRPSMGRLMMSDNTNFYQVSFKDVFSEYFPSVHEYSVGLEPNETECLGASDWAFMADYLVFCTYNAYKWPAQLKLLDACLQYAGPDKLIVVALRSPEDLAILPENVHTIIATYGVAECSIRALARTIRGAVQPTGVLPVGVGGGSIARGAGLTVS